MCDLDLDLIISPGAQIGGTARLTVDDPSSGFFATPTLLLAGHLGSYNSPDLKRFNPSNLHPLKTAIKPGNFSYTVAKPEATPQGVSPWC